MKFAKVIKLNISLACVGLVLGLVGNGTAVAAYQSAWDNPNANMSAGSLKPGYAQLSWAKGNTLPLKLRSGMVTLVTLPNGEQISDIIVGDTGLFQVEAQEGGNSMFISPIVANQGADTNMIVEGKSGNKYIFYLRAAPTESEEITYSQVDIVLDGNATLPMANAPKTTGTGMNSIFNKSGTSSSKVVTVSDDDYGWIKSMKIDPSEFRFDLDIFVPNPDDYVIAPERVWRDRIFTYIDFGDKVISMTQRPVVSLLVEGGESPVGFRTDGEDGRLLIVEAVGDMVLRSGQRIVCIKKREKPFLIADTASVMALAEANVAQSIMSGQSLNNIAYNMDMAAMNMNVGNYTASPTFVGNGAGAAATGAGYYMPAGFTGDATMGASTAMTMVPTVRDTAGAYLPQTNIPLISSNQGGVAVELKSDTSVEALNNYWTELLAKFSGDSGKGILDNYKESVFFAVDEQGVGELGAESTSARLYRLRIGPLSSIDVAQKLCDQLLKFSSTSCSVVRIQ